MVKRGETANKVYEFIKEFMVSNGYSPSIREIGVGTGLSSTSTVQHYVKKLEEQGKIRTAEFGTRTISLVGYRLVKEEENSGTEVKTDEVEVDKRKNC